MISNYKIGYPCKLGETVFGRIVSESDEGSWGNINGIDMWSIPLFATPHGSIVKTGIAYLNDLNEEDRVKLLEFERLAKEDNEWYGGYLNNTEDYDNLQT